jgi:nitrate/nitrite transport system permease protein
MNEPNRPTLSTHASDDELHPGHFSGTAVEDSPIPPAMAPGPPEAPPPSPIRRLVARLGRSTLVTSALPPLVGAAVLFAIWHVVAAARPDLPSPAATVSQLRELLANPFKDANVNDQGILLQLGKSIGRVFAGFAVAAMVAVPLGFLIGAVAPVRKALNPIIAIFRPVSPLAWFPLALAVLADVRSAIVWTVAITALWPTVVNTAMGVAGVPQDNRDVARVFRFSRRKYVRHVLLPYSMTSIVTGLRLSMGIGWMVIVAAEMLSGQPGIGSFVWVSYNNNNRPAMVAAIALIGAVGFGLDYLFTRLARHFDYQAAS